MNPKKRGIRGNTDAKSPSNGKRYLTSCFLSNQFATFLTQATADMIDLLQMQILFLILEELIGNQHLLSAGEKGVVPTEYGNARLGSFSSY